MEDKIEIYERKKTENIERKERKKKRVEKKQHIIQEWKVLKRDSFPEE